ncbi:MAG: hypothetical protein DHS20C11_23690 [Lysobacteraceae bacterium]|nr:MAG: hypothetical protein DHS20C11_23690 [Xanthomonadaceae bacterium]
MSGPSGDTFEFARPGLLRLLNPLAKTQLSFRNTTDQTGYTLINTKERHLLFRLFGPTSSDWCVVFDKTPLARLHRHREQGACSGPFAWLKQAMQPAHWVLVSTDGELPFSAPVFLALMLLFDSLLKK